MEPNRKAEPHQLLTMKKSPVGGRGAFARRDISEGTRIIEYKGKRKKWSSCKEAPEACACFFCVGEDMVIDPFSGGLIVKVIGRNNLRHPSGNAGAACRAVNW
jgi:hypothetical protein